MAALYPEALLLIKNNLDINNDHNMAYRLRVPFKRNFTKVVEIVVIIKVIVILMIV